MNAVLLVAMASARPYRAQLQLETVLEEFRRGRGVQWDDRIVDEFLDLVHAEQIAAPRDEPAASPVPIRRVPA